MSVIKKKSLDDAEHIPILKQLSYIYKYEEHTINKLMNKKKYRKTIIITENIKKKFN